MNGLEIEPEFARFDASQIEKLVNGLGQLFDANQRRRDELALAGGEIRRFLLQHEQRHPERRQWRLQFVRRDRDELRPHFVEAHEIGDVVQHENRTALLRRQPGHRDHARQQSVAGPVALDRNRPRQISHRRASSLPPESPWRWPCGPVR